LRAGHC